MNPLYKEYSELRKELRTRGPQKQALLSSDIRRQVDPIRRTCFYHLCLFFADSYTSVLAAEDPTVYGDKMRSTNNMDEILQTSDGYAEEPHLPLEFRALLGGEALVPAA